MSDGRLSVPDEKEVIISYDLTGVAPGEVVSSVWSRLVDGSYTSFAKGSLTVPEEFKNRAHFTFSLVAKGGSTHPPGKYKADIVFKERVLSTVFLRLVPPGASPNPPVR
jgi:hypothetical protein